MGKAGFASDKREGDNCTPIGVFALRECWYRADKIPAPQTSLPLYVISENDGWSDDARAMEYNRHVVLPYDFSHEKLWREDGLYDLIVPLGYNDDPTVSGKGSAIFMHIAKPDYSGTEGCVALAREDLLAILPHLSPDLSIEIHAK